MREALLAAGQLQRDNDDDSGTGSGLLQRGEESKKGDNEFVKERVRRGEFYRRVTHLNFSSAES